jgi:hypothetical protein
MEESMKRRHIAEEQKSLSHVAVKISKDSKTVLLLFVHKRPTQDSRPVAILYILYLEDPFYYHPPAHSPISKILSLRTSVGIDPYSKAYHNVFQPESSPLRDERNLVVRRCLVSAFESTRATKREGGARLQPPRPRRIEI